MMEDKTNQHKKKRIPKEIPPTLLPHKSSD